MGEGEGSLLRNIDLNHLIIHGGGGGGGWVSAQKY